MKTMETWVVAENPQGEVYRNLMRVLVDYSDKFYFVTRKELSYDQNKLKLFEPYMIKTYKTKEWAGTITLGPHATVYEIEANEQTYSLLVELADSLYDWVSPELPEDLTFIKNGFEWFYSTTYEAFACFCFRNAFYKSLMLTMKGLPLEKVAD